VGRVFIPLLNKTIESNLLRFDMPSLPTIDQLEFRLEQIETRVAELAASDLDVGSIHPLIATARDAVMETMDSDADATARADARLQEAELLLDEIEANEAPRLALQELDASLQLATEIVESYGQESHTKRLDQLRVETERATSQGNASNARSVRERLFTLAFEVYWSQPGAWVSRFQELAVFTEYTDHQVAQIHIRQGRQALEAGDLELLKRSVVDLIALTPRQDQAGRFGPWSGIAKSPG